LKNLVRLSSLLLALLATVNIGFSQEKKQPLAPAGGTIVGAAPAEYNPASWKEHKSGTGRFSILFPGTPQAQVQKLKVGQSEIIIRTLQLQELAAYSVMYSDYPVPVANAEAASGILDFTAQQAVEMFKAEPLDRQKITFEGHPGRFLKQRLPDGFVMHLKFYLVGQKLYQLMITTPKEDGATDDQRRFYEATATKFLGSFKLAPAASVLGSGVGVLGPVGPVAGGSARGAPVSAPKNLPRASVSGGVLNGKAISKPAPAYPAAAVKERVEGVVTVAIVIDEEGKVMAAEAVGGPELLREATVAAALKARFSPTRLSGQPVKISGLLTYNFVLR